MPSSSFSSKKLRPLQLAAVIFLTVSGGPYGLEPLLTYAGKSGALLLLLITPLLWDIPTIAVVLELNSMMPVTGGYYQWVKKALGLRWAFYEGWWTWLYTFVDLAIYPVLFITYASFIFPQVAAYKIPICLIIIWTSAALNIVGIVPVGKTSLFFGAIVLIPFVVLLAEAFFKHSVNFFVPALSLRSLGFSSVGMGLYTIMWNFIGWDNTTTYAEEVDKPIRSYLLSVTIAFTVILAVYFITVFVAQQSGIDVTVLSNEGFPALGLHIGGYWLGVLIAIGGMASALGLYAAVLLSVSRVPQVMAGDHLLPAIVHQLHPKFKTPYVSIIICSIIVSALVWWSFEDLLVIDVTLYGAGLFLEFIALLVLRKTAKHLHRPFKIPLNIPGLCLMILLPVMVYILALSGAFLSEGRAGKSVLFAILALFSAEVIWRLICWRKAAAERRA